jgi:serine phosphatase RsbU (regulator of sigma subunit)/catechol 2,3-dioxygenase-like lactoylglutathione lyase family enzyme
MTGPTALAEPDRTHTYLRLHSVDVFVRDQERSLRFYVDRLGFQLAFDARLHSGERWIGVAPPDGSALLTLRQPKPDSPEAKLIGRATRVVFVTEDVAAKFREWSARGVRFRHTPRLRRIKYEQHAAGWSTPGGATPESAASPLWGEVITRFEDVDRNSFALVSFDEVNRAIEAQRRAYEEKLEADRRAAQELEIARQVQARLFPQTLPPVGTLEYAGVCVQARQVGGDYYDFLNLGRDRLGLIVGDIAGKGIAAALLMANLQANVRTQCATALDEPEQFLRSVNRLFHQNTTAGAYATLFFAEYDDKVQRLRYVNCGHLAGLLLRAGGQIERLDSTCTVLGLFENWDCTVGERQLLQGDTLVLYTDGVTESLNGDGDEFGEQRLLNAILQNRNLSPEELVSAILESVQAFAGAEQQDDITLIVARVPPEPA